VIEICCARKVLPVIKAVATFGLDLLEPADSAITALNGFLAGILLGFDPARSAGLAASYCIEIDDRRSEFGVAGVNLTAAKESPAVTVTTTAADLIAARLGATAAERKAALRRCKFDGTDAAVNAMRAAFQLSADPGLAVSG
jgi:hypothetical protein